MSILPVLENDTICKSNLGKEQNWNLVLSFLNHRKCI